MYEVGECCLCFDHSCSAYLFRSAFARRGMVEYCRAPAAAHFTAFGRLQISSPCPKFCSTQHHLSLYMAMVGVIISHVKELNNPGAGPSTVQENNMILECHFPSLPGSQAESIRNSIFILLSTKGITSYVSMSAEHDISFLIQSKKNYE